MEQNDLLKSFGITILVEITSLSSITKFYVRDLAKNRHTHRLKRQKQKGEKIKRKKERKKERKKAVRVIRWHSDSASPPADPGCHLQSSAHQPSASPQAAAF